ncbi:hypothetical protein ES703_12753 [subsurface metagenome]
MRIADTATSVDLSADNGNHPGGASVDLAGKIVQIASQPGQREDLSPTLMSDGVAGWEKYGTHSGADIDVGTGDYWSMFVYSDARVWEATYDYYTWDEIHTALDDYATVYEVKVELRYPEDDTDYVESTVYVDDITVDGVAYDLEPRVINTDTSEGFNTIQAAIDDGDTDAGDTITCKAGTYTENVVIDESVTLESVAGPVTTIIDASGEGDTARGAVSIGVSNITLGGAGVGFTIIAPDATVSNPGQYGIELWTPGTMSGVTVEGNIIRGSITTGSSSPQYGIHFWRDVSGGTFSSITIEDNTFTTTFVTDTTIVDSLSCGMVARADVASISGTFEGNSITGGYGKGIMLHQLDAATTFSDNTVTGCYYEGIDVGGTGALTISGNTVSDNAGAGVDIRAAGATSTVTENSIHGNGDGIKVRANAVNITIEYNNIYSNTNATAVLGETYGPDSGYYKNYGVYNTGGTLVAENNWWGNASGPVPVTPPATGYNSYGDTVDDASNVDYEPWLLEVVNIADPDPTTYDKTLALKDGWTLVSTDKEVTIDTAWVGTTVLSSTDTILAYKYTPGTGFPQVTMATQLTSVDAYYIKTDGGGGVGINYSTSAPGVVTKTLSAGWNIISCAAETDAYTLLSQLRHVQIGQQQGVGVTNLIGQATYGQYTETSLSVSMASDGAWLIFYSAGETLNAFDGYWVYMNAAKSFGVIPDVITD